jgi:hypothetical protein
MWARGVGSLWWGGSKVATEKGRLFRVSDSQRFALGIFFTGSVSMILAFSFIEVNESIRWLPHVILIFFAIPLFCEMITVTRNNVKTNHKKPINTNFKKILKIGYLIIIILTLLFLLSPIYAQTLLKYHIGECAQSKTAKTDLHKLISEITRGYSDDTNKTKAILRWFDRDSGHIANTFGKEHLLKIYPLHVYMSEPYICIRLIKHENPLWVLKSRCGACNEYALLFMELANASNLTVRSIHNNGEDHIWAEVLIDGNWIAVDPSIVHLSENETGFDVTQMLNEEWWNISHTRALYPDGIIEDVTYLYTNLSNLTIITIDENKTPVSNVSIRVLSHNRQDEKGNIGIDTEINRTTDPEGRCEIKVGGGNYTIIGEKTEDNSYLSAKTTIALAENENNSAQLILKKDRLWWVQYLVSSLRPTFLILCSLGLWVFIVLYMGINNEINWVNENYDRIKSIEDKT